jgi:thioester reductase-like protein
VIIVRQSLVNRTRRRDSQDIARSVQGRAALCVRPRLCLGIQSSTTKGSTNVGHVAESTTARRVYHRPLRGSPCGPPDLRVTSAGFDRGLFKGGPRRSFAPRTKLWHGIIVWAVQALSPNCNASLAGARLKVSECRPVEGVDVVLMENCREDAALDPSIAYAADSHVCQARPRVALLTGATGFLGAHLLADLLRHTSLAVRCLVRASDPENAMARIRRRMVAQRVWHNDMERRIRPVVGDLSHPRLGMSESRFAGLGNQVDVIYHNAARVNLALPYRALKLVNVAGTHELLRLASVGQPKRFHYVSSMAVFRVSPGTEARAAKDRLSVSRQDPVASGYAKSKWLAEQLVNEAAARGLSATIYRPGLISGHSQTGVCNDWDLFSLILRVCMRLGVAPIFDGAIHLTPVDVVSLAIVQLSCAQSSQFNSFQLLNPVAVPWRLVLHALCASGHVRGTMAYGQWLWLVKRNGQDRHNKDIALLAMLINSTPPFREIRQPWVERTGIPRVLYQTDGASLLKLYISHCRSVLID